MATEKESKELKSVATIRPFPQFEGKRTVTDKRCLAGRLADVDTGKRDKDGKAITKPGPTIKTGNKVEIQLPIPTNDDEAKAFYGSTMEAIVAFGVRQVAYTLNKADTYLATIGEKEIDIPGLTSLVEGDLPRQERTKKVSEVKAKAAKFDELKAKYGVSDEELDAILAHAKAKAGNAKPKGK